MIDYLSPHGDSYRVEPRYLKRIRHGISKAITRSIIEKVEWELKDHDNPASYYVGRCVVLDMIAYLWFEELGPHEWKHPKTWWDAFKERWFYDWMKERWPVEYEKHSFEFRVMYPDFRPPMNGSADFGRYVVHSIHNGQKI